jgi:hypothetical protein
MIGKIAKVLKRFFFVYLNSVLINVYISIKIIFKSFYPTYFKLKLKKVQANHKKALEKVRKKEKIKVAFFLIHESVWKYESVYKLMEQYERFEPIVIVCPYVAYGDEIMLHEMNQAYQAFKQKGYNIIKTLGDNGKWLDVKKEINPDIIFFTNPHNLTKKEYYITSYMDALTCYVPYFFQVNNLNESNFNGILQNFCWKVFNESVFHYECALKYSRNKAINVVVSGFPGLDKIFSNDYIPFIKWKNTNTNESFKIIWAPHHTIEGQGAGLDYSSFFTYADYFIALLLNNIHIQMAFKPHPLLKPKLYKHETWGKAKTDDYYNVWNNLPNGQLEEGEYIDLFYTSDALILDSASFIIEYLYFNKPYCFTINDIKVKNRFNSFGQMAFNHMYLASSENEVWSFINEVVIHGNDYLGEFRKKFFNENVMPSNGKTASENIFNEVLKELS